MILSTRGCPFTSEAISARDMSKKERKHYEESAETDPEIQG